MAAHKYTVGQTVQYTAGAFGRSRTTGSFHVFRRSAGTEKRTARRRSIPLPPCLCWIPNDRKRRLYSNAAAWLSESAHFSVLGIFTQERLT